MSNVVLRNSSCIETPIIIDKRHQQVPSQRTRSEIAGKYVRVRAEGGGAPTQQLHLLPLFPPRHVLQPDFLGIVFFDPSRAGLRS